MAGNILKFKNKLNNNERTAPIGFSWTTLFFGSAPAALRGDWKWAILMMIISSATCGIGWIVFPFIYNKIYIKELLSDGYTAIAVEGRDFSDIERELGIVLF